MADNSFMQEFLAGFGAGENHRKSKVAEAADAEDRKLRIEQHRLEAKRLQLEEKLKARDEARKQVGFMETQPAATKEVAPGLQGPPQTLPNAPVNIPGVEELGLGAQSVTPRSLEDVVQQKIAAEIAAKKGERDASRVQFPGTSDVPAGEYDPAALTAMGAGATRALTASEGAADRENARAVARIRESGAQGTFNPKTFQQETRLRSDFNKETEPFRTLDDMVSRVKAGADDTSGQNDVALLYSFMKLLDPGSVVRESEYATAARVGSLLTKAQQWLGEAATGQKLTPENRKEIVRVTEELYNSVQPRRKKIREKYVGAAKRYGLDPSMVMDDMGAEGASGPADFVYDPKTKSIIPTAKK